MLWETRPLGTVGLPMFSADGQHITLVAQEDRHPVIQVLDHIALFDHLDGARWRARRATIEAPPVSNSDVPTREMR